jgi:hypothetical protein
MNSRRTVILLSVAAILALSLTAVSAVASPLSEGPGGERGGGAAVAAPVSESINYQGQLSDPNTGEPLDGSYTMQFQLYGAEAGGSPVWDSGSQSVQVDNGLFNVELDVDQRDFNGQALWLRIGVGGQWLTPRREILPVPYALSLRPGAWIEGSVDGGKTLFVRNDSSALGSTGILGWAYATSGETYGLWGESRSSDGQGVYGIASAESGNTYGVWGASRSTAGRGVYGRTTAASGTTYGVYGESDSTSGRGVLGEATATSGDTYGVYGKAGSPAGYGVYGEAPVYGVGGHATRSSNLAVGVWGVAESASGFGVHGACLGDGATRGVSGIVQSAEGVGGYFKNQSSEGGLGLRVESQGMLIEAWDGDPLDRRFRVNNAGGVFADGTFNPGGADLAEMLPAVDGLEPGDVLVIGPDGKLARSSGAYSTAVAGVYSTKPGFVGGSDEDGINPGKVPLAVVGVVPVKVSAESGPIAPGDLLTTSRIAGHAMKASEPKLGTILGKALGALPSGTGVIEILVMLQ